MCEILLQSALFCAVPFPRQQSRTGLRQSALLVRRARLQHGFFLPTQTTLNTDISHTIGTVYWSEIDIYGTSQSTL